MGQKRLTPRNKKKFTKIAFQIFVNFSLFPKEFPRSVFLCVLLCVVVFFFHFLHTFTFFLVIPR
ncbi:MAG: hypothetical protein E6012_10585 [Enterococcus faecium]|nr:hypothetical protein [Enterococcus faecium]